MVQLPHINRNIWPQVRLDDWKYRTRTRPITLVEIHCTRSGIPGRTPANEYGSTINWSLTPNNINRVPGDDWASMESFICGAGQVCRVLADNVYPHYSLGHADPEAISIEIGQNLQGTAFDPRDLQNAAQICAYFSERNGIPVRVLDWLSADNHEAPGYVRHDRSRNGQISGKSDPGRRFNDRDFEALVRGYLTPVVIEPPTPPTPEEVAELEALARISVAGIFAYYAAKRDLNAPIPKQTTLQLTWLLGGLNPRRRTGKDQALKLFAYAEARALQGEVLDPDAVEQMRYDVQETKA